VKLRLSPKQQEIVNHQEGALLVVAGPGSGKTRVLTERIRRLLAECAEQHFRILALTFTNKAANEMKERLSEFPDINSRAYIGTVHSFCMEVLDNRGKSLGLNGLPHIFESFQDRKQILLQAVQRDPLLSSELRGFGGPKEQGQAIGRWLTAIEDLKNQLKVAELVEDVLLRRVYEAYSEEMAASNAIDFGDILLLTYQLFSTRPKVADFYRRQYRFICIDESQDLNEAQYQLLRALTGGEYFNVLMVGDPKQAIYEFNGASPKYLDRFVSDFGAKRIELAENYRSSTAIVKAATALIPAYVAEGKTPIAGAIQLIRANDEAHEAELVIDYIQKLEKQGHADIEGKVTLERCALLARNKYTFRAAEEELKKRQIPFHKTINAFQDSESDLFKAFELAMKIAANPLDKLHLQALLLLWKATNQINSFNSVSSFPDLIEVLSRVALSDDKKNVLAAVKAIGVQDDQLNIGVALKMLKCFCDSVKADEERAILLQDFQSWSTHWDVFVRSQPGGQKSLSSFLANVSLGATQQPRQEGLALLTVHASKGLEFDVVVLMGMVEGVFPDYRSTAGDALKEELRNVFVAVTRSRRLLALSYPEARKMPWGDIKLQTPSRYLKTLNLIK
jgi:DNA helicase-2/ATP-dependent DNA helicase PcrA